MTDLKKALGMDTTTRIKMLMASDNKRMGDATKTEFQFSGVTEFTPKPEAAAAADSRRAEDAAKTAFQFSGKPETASRPGETTAADNRRMSTVHPSRLAEADPRATVQMSALNEAILAELNEIKSVLKEMAQHIVTLKAAKQEPA